MTRPLVLVGGGRPHLHLLESMAAGRLRRPGTLLVSPASTEANSAMAPGLIRGRYAREELEFDLTALASAAGVEFVEGWVDRIDSLERTVALQGGRSLPFQVASFAIGGDPPGSDLVGVREHALFVKPIHHAAMIPSALERAAREMGPEPVRAAIVGGGAAGVAAALAVRSRLDRLGATQAVVTLVETGHQIMGDHGPATIREAHRALGRAEVTLRLGMTAVEAGAGHVRLANGTVLPADVLIWATGTAGPTVFRDSGLSVDGQGHLLVEDTLQAVNTPGIFATGHSAALRSSAGPARVDMGASRLAPIMAHNLEAALRAEGEAGGGAGSRRGSKAPDFRAFRARTRAVALMDTADGQAILSYGGLAFTSRWAMGLKERLDRKFVGGFRTLTSPSSSKVSSR